MPVLRSFVIETLRDATRPLKAAPGVALLAVVTLGVGIGAATAIFSVVNGVLLRPLPFAQPEQLVRVLGTDTARRSENLSPLDVNDFREQAVLLEVAALSQGSVVLAGGREPASVRSTLASANLFDVLRTTPLLGRLFRAEEETPGSQHVAVLSHSAWQARFGGARDIVGREVTLDGDPFTIVGVLPGDFRSPVWDGRGEPELYRPLPRTQDPGARGGHWLSGIARLRDDVTLAAAQAEMNGITARLATLYPSTNQDTHTRLVPLAIACANVAGLLLTRSAGREREMAIRRALGAGAARIIRQLLAEAVLLGLLGGAVGIGLGYWGAELIAVLAADSLPRASGIGVDGRVLLFAIAVSLVTGVLSGLAPALRLARPDLATSIKEGGATGASGARAQRVRRALVVAETALAVVLLATAGLFAKSMWRLGQVDPGFSGDHVLTGELSIPAATYPDEARASQLFERALTRLEALPGVRSAGAVNILPLSGGYSCDSFTIVEHPAVASGSEECAEARIASPGYFATMGIPLRRGRALTAGDAGHAPAVLVIDETLARVFFPGEDPLGKHIDYNAVSREIVGIVGSVRHFGLSDDPPAQFYLPLAQQPVRDLALALRTDSDPSGLAPSVRHAVAQLDPTLAVAKLRTTEDLVARSTARPRLRTLLLGVFASVALALALLGTYGLIAYFVSRRTREIAVRAALGAGSSDVVRLFLSEGLRLCGAGILIGIALAAASARALSGLLFQVAPVDPWVLAGVALVLGATSTLACYLPARRAARIEPASALRRD